VLVPYMQVLLAIPEPLSTVVNGILIELLVLVISPKVKLGAVVSILSIVKLSFAKLILLSYILL
jgi:hypothetical protein